MCGRAFLHIPAQLARILDSGSPETSSASSTVGGSPDFTECHQPGTRCPPRISDVPAATNKIIQAYHRRVCGGDLPAGRVGRCPTVNY